PRERAPGSGPVRRGGGEPREDLLGRRGIAGVEAGLAQLQRDDPAPGVLTQRFQVEAPGVVPVSGRASLAGRLDDLSEWARRSLGDGRRDRGRADKGEEQEADRHRPGAESYFGSEIERVELIRRPEPTTCFRPEGQSTSTASMDAASPSPK